MTLHWQSTAKIIGIDYYSRKSGLKSLPAPSKDAEAIASLFEAYGEHQQIFIERIPCEQNKTQQGKSAQRVKSDEVVKQAELEKDWHIEEYPQRRNWENEIFERFTSEQAVNPQDNLTIELMKLKQELAVFQTLNDPRNIYARMLFDFLID